MISYSNTTITHPSEWPTHEVFFMSATSILSNERRMKSRSLYPVVVFILTLARSYTLHTRARSHNTDAVTYS